MKFHAAYFRWNHGYDWACIVGFAGGRVHYEPMAKWLYSFRVYFLFAHFEILWTTDKPQTP